MFDRYIELREALRLSAAMNDIDPDQSWYWLVVVVGGLTAAPQHSVCLSSVSNSHILHPQHRAVSRWPRLLLCANNQYKESHLFEGGESTNNSNNNIMRGQYLYFNNFYYSRRLSGRKSLIWILYQLQYNHYLYQCVCFYLILIFNI